MDIPFLIATTLLVSVDSFVCGLSLSLQRKKTFLVFFAMTLTVFILCVIGAVGGKFLNGILPYGGEILGGGVLILVGVLNFFGESENFKNFNDAIYKGISVGFAIGLDGGVATFSLVCLNYSPILVPPLFTLTHLIMILSSILLSRIKILSKISKLNFFPPLIISVLGLIKIISALL